MWDGPVVLGCLTGAADPVTLIVVIGLFSQIDSPSPVRFVLVRQSLGEINLYPGNLAAPTCFVLEESMAQKMP